jgi:hypothetical protein
MSDFESLIRDAIASGASYEDVAEKFADALNKIEDEDNTTPTEALVNEYLDDFDRVYNSLEGDVTIEDVAKLAAIVIYDDHDDWSVEDIEECKDMIEHNIGYCIEMVGKSPLQGLVDGLKKIEEEVKKKTDEDTISEWLRILGL